MSGHRIIRPIDEIIDLASLNLLVKYARNFEEPKGFWSLVLLSRGFGGLLRLAATRRCRGCRRGLSFTRFMLYTMVSYASAVFGVHLFECLEG